MTEDWAFWELTKCSLFLPDAARTPYPAYKIMQNQYIAIIW
ncbi:4-phosphopantetheinyl transferase EntD [Escherichia coli]|nr:4-phosphopantetheinyl transferase EntD [Escherichia coli]